MVCYTINELEKILHRKSKTIKDYIDYGGLKASNINGRYLITEDSLKEFLDSYKVKY
ncbi:MAG: helix-turn-helix domain-containing protein [Clostridia bacterium]|nr:helix-turn-helix domain-containing protein [Clostridia bacterium]